MKQLISLFIITILLFSCDGSGRSGQPEQELPDDSAQLRIAVMPTLDCLPIYLAEAHGFFSQNDLDVALLPFQAQMDCDTAYESGRANSIVTDLVRAERMQNEGVGMKYITATDAYWQLLTSRTARIKQIRQLDDKMLAMTRFSATHLLSDLVVDSAGLKPERVFRIQVNDLNVRLGMLSAGIMDALLLPEPQATDARNQDAYMLFDTRDRDIRLGVVAFNPKAATTRQIEAFRKSYNMACDSLNERGLAAYQDVIKKYCSIQQSTIDSLPAIHFSTAAEPRQQDVERAKEWLKRIADNKDAERRGL